MSTSVDAAIAYATRALRLPVIGSSFSEIASQARRSGWSYEEYLAALLERQNAAREANGATFRRRQAHFPRHYTLEEFNFAHQPSAPRELLAHLATSTYIARRENVILLGPPGTGKTHLAIALGMKAIDTGHRVSYHTATDLINTLVAANQQGRLDTQLAALAKPHLLVIDELGYIPLNADAANLFFQLVSSRYEQGSIIITSNLEFARWGSVLADDTVAAATIDRLIHHVHIIALKGDSYRARNLRQQQKSTKK